MTLFRIEMEIIDIHTHNLPQKPGSALYVLPLGQTCIPEGQLCAAGLHPWDVTENCQDMLDWVSEISSSPSVLAIGECGIDRLRGLNQELQIHAFTVQAEIAEERSKPLIIHSVRSSELILAVRKRLKPRMPWLIHGFRGGPEQADMLLSHGIALSFSGRFKPQSMQTVGLKRVLLETDNLESIDTIVDCAASALCVSSDEMRIHASSNAESFLTGTLVW